MSRPGRSAPRLDPHGLPRPVAHQANLDRDDDIFDPHPQAPHGQPQPRTPMPQPRPADDWPPSDRDYAPQFGQRNAPAPQAHLQWQDESLQPRAHRRYEAAPQPPRYDDGQLGHQPEQDYGHGQGYGAQDGYAPRDAYRQPASPFPTHHPDDPFATGGEAAQPNYDLSQYRPAHPAPQPHYAGGAYDAGAHQGHPVHDPWLEDTNQHPHPPMQRDGGGLQPDGYAAVDDQDHDYDDEYEEQGGGFKRGAIIAAALVGAIAVGAGLAYAYKLVGGGKGSGKPPVLKANQVPAKALPSDPGGKVFAHTDKKYLNRLGEGGAAAQAAGDQESGPRKVRTLVVSRAGDANTPQLVERPVASAEIVPARRAEPVIALPGVTLDGGPTRNTAPPPPPPARSAAPPAPPAAPTVIARAEPPSQQPQTAADIPPPSRSPDVRPSLAPPSQAAQQAKRERVASALRPGVTGARPTATDAPAQAPAPPASRGGGYVAVVTSQRSSMDALKVFADLQQKYSSVLGAKTPEVQQANLGQKGTWYRLTVGPPGSRDAARGLCNQLKAQGFTGCWVKRY